jgi:hypothetical protein
MLTKIEQLETLVPSKNKDIALYAKHIIRALEQFEEHHRRFVAAQAIAGIKPNGEAEATFYNTVKDMREQIYGTLVWTIEDLKHKGDKYYTKHFDDGVE